MRMANAAAAPAAATSDESLWVSAAMAVLVEAAEEEAEVEAWLVEVVVDVWVPVTVVDWSVLVAAVTKASVPVLVPVSVEPELVL